MLQEIKVKKQVVEDIQKKDFARQTAQDTITNITNNHINDADAAFVKSPVFKALQEDAEDKRLEWEKAKDKMVMEFIPKDIQSKVKNWSLDYGTGTLTVEL